MANTGYSQATIAYKVRASDGAALGLDGLPILETGNRQAIALLVGHSNPDSSKYDIEEYFTAEAILDGAPTVELSDNCKTGYLFVTPATIILQPTAISAVISLKSSANWSLIGSPAGIATLSQSSGPRGEYAITITRTATLGQGYYTFMNNDTTQTAKVYVINVSAVVWVLADHTWNNLGFWQDAGIWNY